MPSVLEEAAVALQEIGGREAFRGLLHLRVGESEPYFIYLPGSEETVDNLDVGAQESYVFQSLVQSLGGTTPHAGALNIDAYEVAVGVAARKSYGIFATPAAKLQHYGVVVLEEVLAPAATQRKGRGGLSPQGLSPRPP